MSQNRFLRFPSIFWLNVNLHTVNIVVNYLILKEKWSCKSYCLMVKTGMKVISRRLPSSFRNHVENW